MSKNTRNRILLTAVAALLLVTLTVGGTLAWLTATTETVKNTFSPSNIKIELYEHPLKDGSTSEIDTNGTPTKEVNGYKMVPGLDLQKDPYVTVKAGSEKCWVFIKVTEGNNLDTFISYEVDVAADKWVKLEEGVYYWNQPIDAASADVTKYILKDNKVTVNNVGKTEMDALTNNLPYLHFDAYAVQSENLKDPAGNEITDMDTIWGLAQQ